MEENKRGPLGGPIRPEYRDPSPFPCMVKGCEAHAAGWVLADAVRLFGLELDVLTNAERIYLCDTHVARLRQGTT